MKTYDIIRGRYKNQILEQKLIEKEKQEKEKSERKQRIEFRQWRRCKKYRVTY